MAIKPDYEAGTVSITNGTTTLAGVNTFWVLAKIQKGDTLKVKNLDAIIEEVVSNTEITLKEAWTGGDLAASTYAIRYQPDGSRFAGAYVEIRDLLANGNLTALAALVGALDLIPIFTGAGALTLIPKNDLIQGVQTNENVDTLPERAAFDAEEKGFSVLVNNVGDGRAAVYFKASSTSGDWSDPAYLTGVTGQTPNFAIGTTTTVAPGLSATATITGTDENPILNLGIPAGEGFAFEGAYNGATAYAKGDVARDNGSSWIALQVTTGNAPPVYPVTANAYWELLAVKGSDGTGTGDVVGPASATTGKIAIWDGTTGKLLKEAQALASNIDYNGFPLNGGVVRTALDKLKDSINALDFGCLFDGSTDDYANLQEAVNAAAGKALWLPAGTARLSADLDIPSNTTIYGVFGATWLKPTVGSTSNPVIWNVATKSNVTFIGVGIDGDALNVGSFNGYCQNYGSSHIRYERCYFKNTKGIAVATHGAVDFEDVMVTGCRFENCGQYNLTSGLPGDRRDACWFGGSSGGIGKHMVFERNEANGIGLAFCSFSGGVSSRLRKCRASDNILTDSNGGGIYASHVIGYICHGNHIDGIDGNALDNLTIVDFSIMNNVLTGNSASGIGVFESSNHGVIIGNVCVDNATQNPSASTHIAGITLTALNGETTSDIIISGNVCYDTRAGTVGVTQHHAIGLVTAGTGAFSKINVDRSNRLQGYDPGGVENNVYAFQTFALGAQPYPTELSMAAGVSVVLCPSSERAIINIHIANTGIQGAVSIRGGSAPLLIYETVAGNFLMSDTGSFFAIFISGSNYVLKNRTATTRAVFVSKDMSMFL